MGGLNAQNSSTLIYQLNLDTDTDTDTVISIETKIRAMQFAVKPILEWQVQNISDWAWIPISKA